MPVPQRENQESCLAHRPHAGTPRHMAQTRTLPATAQGPFATKSGMHRPRSHPKRMYELCPWTPASRTQQAKRMGRRESRHPGRPPGPASGRLLPVPARTPPPTSLHPASRWALAQGPSLPTCFPTLGSLPSSSASTFAPCSGASSVCFGLV